MKKSTKNRNILPIRDYAKRQLLFALYAFLLIFFSLSIGVLGYHYWGNIGWIDSLYNAAMILTGMGPVDRLETDGAKIFASIYALFSGVIFLTTVAILLSPLAHRLLYILHVEDENDEE